MADKMFENNQVSIIGEIVSDFQFSHEVYGEGFYMMEVSVRRLSDCMDYIPVMVSERLINVEGDYIGKSVYIGGQFRSFNRHEEKKTGWCCLFLQESLRYWTVIMMRMQPIRFSLMAISARRLYTGKHRLDEKLQPACGSEPLIWQVRLYSMYLLGKKCQICVDI